MNEKIAHPIKHYGLRHPIEKYGFKKTIIVGVVGAVAVGALGYAVGEAQNNLTSSPSVSNPNEISLTTADIGCSNFESSNSSSNPNTYYVDAFLPKPMKPVTSNETAQNYVNQLFSKTGPLAGKNGDIESLAAIMSTVVVPAQQGAISNPNYNYVDIFDQEIARYHVSGGEGVTAAAADCAVALDTLVQVESYNDDWIESGADVTEFIAVRNSKNDIVGMKLEHERADQTLEGLVLKLNRDVKRVDGVSLKGFTEILISTNPSTAGEIFAKGIKIQPNSSNGGKAGKEGDKKGNGNSGLGNGPTGSAPTPGNGPLPGPGKGGGEGKGPKPTTTTTIGNTPTTTTTSTTTTTLPPTKGEPNPVPCNQATC